MGEGVDASAVCLKVILIVSYLVWILAIHLSLHIATCALQTLVTQL